MNKTGVVAALALVAASTSLSCRSLHKPTQNRPTIVATPREQPPNAESEKAAVTKKKSSWEAQTNPSWPKGCLIEDIGLHPSLPWLAFACWGQPDGHNHEGALVVLDLDRGTLHSTHRSEAGRMGWPDDGNLLRWHPDGDRLAVNMGTNGIAVYDGNGFVGVAYPDETRDSGVCFVWIGDQIFTDTGHLLQIVPGYHQTMLRVLDPPFAGEIEWNDERQAVVGTLAVNGGQGGLTAVDFTTRSVSFRKIMGDIAGGVSMAPDGRYAAHAKKNTGSVAIYSASTGDLVKTVEGSDFVVGHNGNVMVAGVRAGELVATLIKDGATLTELHLGARTLSRRTIGGAHGAAWSPSGDRIALLFRNSEVGIYETATGRKVAGFAMPHPAPPKDKPARYPGSLRIQGALQWIDSTRLAHIEKHHVTVWSTTGSKLQQFLMP